MVYAMGEMLLDVIMDREWPREEWLKHGHPGGAMLNAAVSLARSGIQTALISEAGDDDMGAYLVRFLKGNRVNTKYIRQYTGHPTSVALARLDERKKPAYTFAKHYPARRNLLLPEKFNPDDLLLFGSLYALDPAIRSEVAKIVRAAKNAGVLVLYDPNIRMAEQLSDKARKEALFENLQIADIIKGSDEDFQAIFGRQTPKQHISSLQRLNPEAVIFITLGEQGALAAWKNRIVTQPARKVKMVSTIGAGDGFNAGVISGIVRNELSIGKLSNYLESLLNNGIAFSAEVCQSKDNYIPLK
jgi:fructokinase